jgi:maleylpyruvate isomerase
MDPTSRDDPRLVDAVRTHTDLLVGTARALDDAAAPSVCVGWTRGHVLTHVARNADGMAALVRAAVDGSGEAMYVSP